MAAFVGATWHLYRGDALVAELVVTDSDFPWLYARLEALEGFEEVRHLFVEEQRLLEAISSADVAPEDVDAWEAAYARVRDVLTLRYPHGGIVPEYLLHIEDGQAWWRWSDERDPE